MTLIQKLTTEILLIDYTKADLGTQQNIYVMRMNLSHLPVKSQSTDSDTSFEKYLFTRVLMPIFMPAVET